jgi:hypothetical protein
MDMTRTFEIVLIDGARAIRCLLCGSLSVLPGDVVNRYCARCHLFHDSVADCRRAVAAGAGHDCEEWRTGRYVCALCGRLEDTLVAAMALELERKAPMEIVCQPLTVVQLTGLLQLALRHPTMPPDARAAGERFLAGVRAYFSDCPTVLDIVRRGDDPAEDL